VTRKAFVAPISIDLSITDACNLKCSYCYADAGPSKFHYMNKEKMKNFAKEVVDIGVHYIRIAGGEPFLHPDTRKERIRDKINRLFE
jgi:molybdenum cofactor biosynthesis enzyme MoaA